MPQARRVELFKITCVTCQARLSVHNEGLIGQIISCPRCGNMVEVAPPAPPAEPEPVTPEPEAQTPAPVEEPAPPVQELPAEQPPAAVEQPTTPPPTGAGSLVAKLRGLLWVAVSVAALGSGAAVRVLWPSGEDAAQPPTVAAEEQPSQPAPVEAVEPVEPAPPTDEQPTQPPVEPTPEQPQPPAEPAEPDLVTQLPALPGAGQDAQPEDDDLIQGEPEETDPASELPEFDPLDMDPEGLHLALLDSHHSAEVYEGAAAADEEPEDEPQPPAEPAGVPVITRSVERSEQESRIATADAQEALDEQLPGFRARRLPLSKLLDLTATLSGATVSVAPEELLMSAVEPDQPVAAYGEDATLGEVLASGLKPLKLTGRAEGPHVVVERSGTDRWREVEYPVEDLTDNTAGVRRLADDIRRLVAPASWDTGAKPGTIRVQGQTLVVAQTERVQYQVLFLLERLRLAGGLTPRTRYPVKMLDDKRREEVRGRLSAPATYTFSRFTPLGEVFEYWQAELPAPVLVDWPALAERQLWPDTLIRCYALDQSWGEAIDAVAGPLGLYCGVADVGALHVTTREAAQTVPVVRVYPLEVVDRASLEGRLASFVEKLRENVLPTASEADTVLVFNPRTLALAARLPEAGQDELRTWLESENLLRD